MLEGGRALAAGITGATDALASSIAKEQQRQQQMRDELDAFKGMGEFMTRSGQLTAEQLNEISSMPLPKAKGYMTSMVADATRKQEAMTAEKLAAIRTGDRNEIIYDNGRALKRGADGNYSPVTGDAPPRQVPVVDPTTGTILNMVPEGSIMGSRPAASAAEREPKEFTASTGEKFIIGPSGQMTEVGKPQARTPTVGIGTVIPTEAGQVVVKGFDRYGNPETQLVPDSAETIQAKEANRQKRAKVAGDAAALRAKEAGGNKRPGPDFLPFGTPYGEQAARKEAELAQLGGSPQARAAAPSAPGAPAGQISPRDQEALNWARQNPGDPRSAAILKRLGM